MEPTILPTLLSAAALPANAQQWLQATPQLTNALRKCFSNYDFQVTQQCLQACDPIAQAQLFADQAWIRQGAHTHNNTPLIFTHVIVPISTFQAHQNAFESLGQAQIGPALLYNNANIIRNQVSLHETTVPECYARSTLYHWHSQPFLITEIFTPQVLNTPCPSTQNVN